jgi:acetyl esterase/lipase
VRRAWILVLATLIAACNPLRAFNAVVPQDRGGRVAARAQAYGVHPRQKLDLYRPASTKSAAQGPLPIIVFIYGGSWQDGTREGYGFAGRALASRGFLAAVPDYRLVPEAHYPDFVEDCAAAVRWVRANAARFGGDPDRIVLVGHSAGAYNAAMLALDPRWLGSDRAAIRGFAGLAGPYDFLPLDLDVTRAAFGRARDLPSTQPINHASPGDPPALLLHGAADTTAYPRNSQLLADRLRSAGVAVDLKIYPEVGHVGILTAISRWFRGREGPMMR